MFRPLQSLFNLVPPPTWGLREGAHSHLSLKCRVTMTATHMGQILEQHYHPSLRSRCPTTQVSIWREESACQKKPILCFVNVLFAGTIKLCHNKPEIHSLVNVSLTSPLCRKPNNSCLCHPSLQAWLLRILCLHTTHFLPQSLLDVLSAWTWWCAATVGRLCKDVCLACHSEK